LFRAIGRDDYASDPVLATNEGRVARGEELDQVIAAWTTTKTADEIVDLLRREHVPVSRVNNIADIVADPQFQARGSFVEVEDDRLERPLLVPGVVPRLSRTPGTVPPLSQELGAATEEVRRRMSQRSSAKRQDGRRGTG
jgi:formyl-CoA transferase